MKKLAIAIIGASLILSACGTKTIIVQQEATTTTFVAPPTTLSNEDEYVEAILSEYPSVVNNLGKNFILEFADTICKEIDNGLTLQELVLMSVQYGVDATMLGFMTSSAIRNFCPHNQWFIDAALNA